MKDFGEKKDHLTCARSRTFPQSPFPFLALPLSGSYKPSDPPHPQLLLLGYNFTLPSPFPSSSSSSNCRHFLAPFYPLHLNLIQNVSS